MQADVEKSLVSSEEIIALQMISHNGVDDPTSVADAQENDSAHKSVLGDSPDISSGIHHDGEVDKEQNLVDLLMDEHEADAADNAGNDAVDVMSNRADNSGGLIGDSHQAHIHQPMVDDATHVPSCFIVLGPESSRKEALAKQIALYRRCEYLSLSHVVSMAVSAANVKAAADEKVPLNNIRFWHVY